MCVAHMIYTLLLCWVVICIDPITACWKEDWFYLEKVRKFIIYQEGPETCSSAFKSCKELGGQSLIIPDNVTQNAVHNRLKSTCPSVRDDLAWIGLSNSEGSDFHWVDGKELGSLNYTKWRTGQPETTENSVCVAMETCTGGLWYGLVDTLRKSYICESTSPCYFSPVIKVNGGENIEESIPFLVTDKQNVRIECSVHGYTKLIAYNSLNCGGNEKLGVHGTLLQTVNMDFHSNGTTCVCSTSKLDGSSRKLKITLISAHYDLEQLKDLHQLPGRRFDEKLHEIMNKLDLTTKYIGKNVDVSVAESILKTVARITDCCIYTADSKTRQGILTYIDRVAAAVSLTENGSFYFSSKDIGLSIHNVSKTPTGSRNPIVFHGLISPINDQLTIELVKDKHDPDINTLTTITLPMESIFHSLSQADKHKLGRISVTMYRSAEMLGLSPSNENMVIQSSVVSIDVPGVGFVQNLDEDILITFLQEGYAKLPTCVFWNTRGEHEHDVVGHWESNGCRLSKSGNDSLTCSCNHLTNFALMMAVDYDKAMMESDAFLENFSFVGCSLSILALFITLVTYLMFPPLRQDNPSKILMHLCGTLMFANILFIANAILSRNINVAGVLCKVLAISLHHFTLVSLMWMSCDAYYLYMGMVKVFLNNRRSYLTIFTLTSWGIPFLLVILTATVGFLDNYNFINNAICWIKKPIVYFVFILPAGLILAFNFTIFFFVIRFLKRASSAHLQFKRREAITKQLKGTMSIASLLGLTWGFGFLAVLFSHIALSYLFVIFNTLQGFFIFIFYCVLKPDIKYFWTRLFLSSRPSGIDKSGYKKSTLVSGNTSMGVDRSRVAETSYIEEQRDPVEERALEVVENRQTGSPEG